jgi:hypothetical protein
MKRIYIAGRVTGKEYRGVRLQFSAAKQFLLDQGFDEVVSPVEIVPPGTGWAEAMLILLPYLATCNYMALLPGYEPSNGAMCEYYFARGMENEGKLRAIIHLQIEKPRATAQPIPNIEMSGTLKTAI